MSMVKATPYYLFTREQLLGALEAHVAGLGADGAAAIRTVVLDFLDGSAAAEHGLQVKPKAIRVGENAA